MGITPHWSCKPRDPICTVLRRLEYIYLMRFPLMAAAFLALGLPAGYRYAPAMFTGLFDAGQFWAFAFVVWMEFMLTWSIMVTIRLILTYGRDRFSSLMALNAQKPGALKWRQVFGFGLIALPALACTWAGSESIGPMGKLGATLLGLLGSLIVLLVAAISHFKIEHGGGATASLVLPAFGFAGRKSVAPDNKWDEHRWWLWKLIDAVIRKLPEQMTEGLWHWDTSFNGNRKKFLRSGHEMAFVTFLILLADYGLGYFYSPDRVSENHQPAALFYLLFLITLATWVFYMAAFLLDRFRLPVLTMTLVLSFLTGFIRTDHLYDVVPHTTQEELPASQVIRQWENGPRQGRGKPVTVVATAGGGIQASAWTTQVLTGMQQECGSGEFASSLLLVSSVSGGSVGTMYFLVGYDNAGKYPTDLNTLQTVRDNALRSSLSAAGWGLLYPDALRTLPFLGILVPQDRDRGWALENAWITRWSHPPNLSDWRRDVELGIKPAVIFNATAAESGQRFLLSSTELSTPGGMQFAKDYDGWDLPIATAARLSATFPYVSPMARASAANDEAKRVHVGDGGYYDNSGMVSALSWLVDAEKELRGRTVVLIIIDSGVAAPAGGKFWSWQKQMVAPVSTMLHLRTSSQHYRGDFEATLVKEWLESNGVKVILAPFPYTRDMPLSWHLNATQKENVEQAWKTPNSQVLQSKHDVLSALGCQAPGTNAASN